MSVASEPELQNWTEKEIEESENDRILGGGQVLVYQLYIFGQHTVVCCCPFTTHGHVNYYIQDIVHDPGRGAPLAKVQFRDPYKYRMLTETFLAVEGMHTGQFIYCGKKGV